MKTKHLFFVCASLYVMVMSLSAQTLQDTLYFNTADLPDAGEYLPAPPDTASLLFVDDYQQWVWGKTVRPTARGKQASLESEFSTSCLARIFGEAMQITISEEATPAIWRLLLRSSLTGTHSVNRAKEKYMRVRPFARFNEQVWGEFDTDELRQNGSYPSGHTSLAWAAALAMAEMAPEQQDTILRRGYEYGESRVIVGAHWQSDVDAARMASSATYAYMHNSPEYFVDLAAARAEYKALKSITVEKDTIIYPHITRALNLPPDTASVRFYSDVQQYYIGKAERSTLRGKQAVNDAEYTLDDMLRYYSAVVGMELSLAKTPAIYALFDYTYSHLIDIINDAKGCVFRKRPYVQFDEHTGFEAEEEHLKANSSYPSDHSTLGWGLALVFSPVADAQKDAILKAGFEYGQSRIILGYHYASDVLAGRLHTAAALTQLYRRQEFLPLLDAAKAEYIQLTSDIESVIVQSQTDRRGWYTLSGKKLGNMRPAQSGIYIHNGEKKFVK